MSIDLGMPGLSMVPREDVKQTAKDYTSDQEVRWCPGCGDYAVLAAVRQFLPNCTATGLQRGIVQRAVPSQRSAGEPISSGRA